MMRLRLLEGGPYASILMRFAASNRFIAPIRFFLVTPFGVGMLREDLGRVGDAGAGRYVAAFAFEALDELKEYSLRLRVGGDLVETRDRAVNHKSPSFPF